MNFSDTKRLKRQEAENARLKKLLAESLLKNELTKEDLRKSGEHTVTVGVSASPREQRTQRASIAPPTRMSASSFRSPRPQYCLESEDHRAHAASPTLRCRRELSEAAAGWHDGNHKQVDRPYAEAGLQIRRWKHKKVPVLLERPLAANRSVRWTSCSSGQQRAGPSKA